ncbi:MAG: VOC family protein [Brevinematales bacterium]|jgi:catechol 2,3-dioxygenase-like lactoylglutathione lyase family enzyme
MNKIGTITILVNDIDKALDFYVNKLNFVKRNDQNFGENNRWATISPKEQKEIEFVFVIADTEEKRKRVGSQASDHVFLVLQTDNIKRDYELFKSRGVKFYGEPKKEFWGTEAVFEDLYGNLIDLLELSKQ